MSEEASSHPDIPESGIREELARILRSPIFLQSERLSRFLRFTVETVLADKADTLKEFVIGTDVYGRQPPYHPGTDSIVRTEARRLRGKLRDYYESEGKTDPVLIYFRPGSYVPVFRLRDTASAREAAPELLSDDRLFMEGRGVSIAVVPLQSDRGGGASSVCAAAITDELIHELMHTEGCRVAAAGSVSPSERYSSDLPALAQKLGIHVFFEGSVRQEGPRLRVTIRLVAPDGFQLWSERFAIEPEPDELFDISEKIARSVVNRTRPEMTSIRKLKASAGAGGMKTFPAVLGAGALLDTGEVADIELAILQLREVVEKYPEAARPVAGIAQAWYELALRGTNVSAAVISEAKSLARQAISLDGEMIQAHACLAALSMLEWNWSAAETGFEYALMLGSRAAMYRQYALFLSIRRRFNESWSYLRKAHDMDVFSQRQQVAHARFLYTSRRWAEVDQHFPDRFAYGPLADDARLYLALCYIEIARSGKALKIARELREQAGLQRTTAASLAGIFARCGETALANEIVAGFDLFAPARDISLFRQTLLAAAFGDEASALNFLSAAFDNREPELIWIQTDPRLDALGGHPRFVEITAAVAGANAR